MQVCKNMNAVATLEFHHTSSLTSLNRKLVIYASITQVMFFLYEDNICRPTWCFTVNWQENGKKLQEKIPPHNCKICGWPGFLNCLCSFFRLCMPIPHSSPWGCHLVFMKSSESSFSMIFLVCYFSLHQSEHSQGSLKTSENILLRFYLGNWNHKLSSNYWHERQG